MNSVASVATDLDTYNGKTIEEIIAALANAKGRVYIVGLGGSLANAIHMAADLRKLCDLDAEAFDNIAEITARANDEGLETIWTDWLKRHNEDDVLFVLSVGGGAKGVSEGLVRAVGQFKGTVLGIVGPVGGSTATIGDHVLKIPAQVKWITPLTEAFQAVIWHLIVSDPRLQKRATKW